MVGVLTWSPGRLRTAVGTADGELAATDALEHDAAPTAAQTVEVRPGALGENAELVGGLHLWRLDALARAGIGA